MALPTSHNVVTAAQLGSTLSSYNTKLNARFKPKQTAVEDPTASGTTTTAIDSISQDANGVITVTKKTISGITPASHTHGNLTNDGKVGTAADYAVVTTTGGAITATSLATSAPSASGNALSFIDSVSQDSKGKITATKKSVTVDSTYSATGTNPANGKAIAAAISTLDVSAIEGAASKTITSISETDGKISATYSDIAIAQSQVSGLATALNAKAPLASPALTGTPTAPTAAAGTNTTQIATTAFVQTAVTNGLATADALTYKGTVDGGSTGDYGSLTPAANKGDVYKVTTAGKIDGKAVEVGDMLICNTDSTAAATSSNYGTIVANWDFIQTNLDGVVIGPASATSGNIALFDGTTGKLLKNSSYSPSSFATSGHNHDSVYFKSSGNVTLVSGSATKIGTQNGSDVKLTLPTIPAAAKDANLNLQINGGTATKVFSANASSASTVTFGSGTANGTIDVNGTDVAVTGLGSAAYTASSDYATSGHTHATSIATSTGTNQLTLAHGTKYAITAGGTSFVFTMPSSGNTDTKVTQTALAGTETGTYPVLLAPTGQTSTQTTTSNFATALNYKPSTNTLAANISGNAATATTATSATSATSATTASNYASGGTIESALNGKAASGHTHDIGLAADSGTATVTLAHNTTYKLTAGGKSVIFKTPTDNNSDTKVTQNLVAADNTSTYPILLAPTGQTATATTTANFVTGATYKPSTNTLTVNVSGSSASCSGDAATASAAKSGSALETAINGKAASSHSHGNVTSGGAITATAVDIASGDALTIVDSSASGKLVKSSITFDGSTGTKCLTQKGTWATFGTSNLTIGTTSSTAAAGNHTHSASIATSTGTSAITLTPGGKYSLSAGGSSVIFTNGAEMTDQEVTDLLDALT